MSSAGSTLKTAQPEDRVTACRRRVRCTPTALARANAKSPTEMRTSAYNGIAKPFHGLSAHRTDPYPKMWIVLLCGLTLEVPSRNADVRLVAGGVEVVVFKEEEDAQVFRERAMHARL